MRGMATNSFSQKSHGGPARWHTLLPIVYSPFVDCRGYWEEACAHLVEKDDVMARLVARHRGEQLRGSGDAFRTLANAIVGQQISVVAAERIWSRLQSVQQPPGIEALHILETTPAQLRAVGLSGRKVEYLQGIARAFRDGEIDPERWKTMSDDEVRSELIALRGVGPWTADMMLIFYLHRPDVLPLEDIGLINSAARLYGWDTVSALRDQAELWRPWRTVATWYIWRDLDAEPVIY